MRMFLIVAFMIGFSSSAMAEQEIPERMPPEKCKPWEDCEYNRDDPEEPDEPIACTMDAKMCPDGSYVSRQGPNCEFAPCPGENR